MGAGTAPAGARQGLDSGGACGARRLAAWVSHDRSAKTYHSPGPIHSNSNSPTTTVSPAVVPDRSSRSVTPLRSSCR